MKKIVVKYINLFCIVLGLFAISGCNSADESVPLPSPLEDIQVENIAGGVKVSFRQISEPHVTLISARYANDDGGTETKRFVVESGQNSIILSNLSATKKDLFLYTVNSEGKYSSEKNVEIQPLLSPEMLYLQSVLNAIVVEGIASGFEIKIQDQQSKGLIVLIEKSMNNKWVEFKKWTTSSMTESLDFMDFDSSTIRVTLKYSSGSQEIVIKEFAIIPLQEILFDKSKWTVKLLDNDTKFSQPLVNLWDNIAPITTGTPRVEDVAGLFPKSFSIDLGVGQNRKISKIVLFPLANFIANAFGANQPKTYEFYGSNQPITDGSWDNWVKIGTGVSEIPSGGPAVDSDLIKLRNGEIYRLPKSNTIYRYLRIKILNTYTINQGQSGFFRLSEMDVYGVN